MGMLLRAKSQWGTSCLNGCREHLRREGEREDVGGRQVSRQDPSWHSAPQKSADCALTVETPCIRVEALCQAPGTG